MGDAPPTPNAANATSSAAVSKETEEIQKDLAEAEKELVELMNRKRQVDRALATIESNIYTYEGSYLEDTQQYGNIIRGFDGFVNNRNEKRKMKFSESDRLFSLSSVTYLKALELKQREELQQPEDITLKKRHSGTIVLSTKKKKRKEDE
ncbi:Chromatin modification- protein meaf6 [Chytridiales sp. JEL 0842]|nr:Chromatin modification- protein meaf6 [Chytridiales sp. JEL 0842]